MTTDLTQRASRISALMDKREDLDAEIKAAFEIAKNDGYKPAELRKAIKVYRMDDKQRAKHDDAQMTFALYLDELEGRQLREAAE